MSAITTTTVLHDIKETTPTKKDPTGVYVVHNTADRLSLAVQLEENGAVTAALAVCSPRDNFSKSKAQKILRNRLRVRRYNGRLGLTFIVGTYTGSDFKTDVFIPLMKYVRDNSYLFLLRDKTMRGDQRELLRSLVAELRTIRNHSNAHLG